MTILSIILWLILGVLAVMNMYYTFKKDWYLLFKEDLTKQGSGTLRSVKNYAWIFIPFGGLVFLLWGIMLLISFGPKSFTYYFQVPENENLDT